ncbi:hypothetical protein H0N95_02735 [Candidatus Micrarchaeota archaeon]|nr:hypothetical protein [Candidatus Micrarchaeota archaeon]
MGFVDSIRGMTAYELATVSFVVLCYLTIVFFPLLLFSLAFNISLSDIFTVCCSLMSMFIVLSGKSPFEKIQSIGKKRKSRIEYAKMLVGSWMIALPIYVLLSRQKLPVSAGSSFSGSTNPEGLVVIVLILFGLLVLFVMLFLAVIFASDKEMFKFLRIKDNGAYALPKLAFVRALKLAVVWLFYLIFL